MVGGMNQQNLHIINAVDRQQLAPFRGGRCGARCRQRRGNTHRHRRGDALRQLRSEALLAAG
jgi:hypothetical protein